MATHGLTYRLNYWLYHSLILFDAPAHAYYAYIYMYMYTCTCTYVLYVHVHVHTYYTVKPVYSRHLGTQQNCPYYRGVLISEVQLYTLILYCSGTTVLIIEVSLFQSVHNSRFDCTYMYMYIHTCTFTYIYIHVHIHTYYKYMYIHT